MKIVWKSIIGSAILHVVYIGGTLLTGYIKTMLYQPDIPSDLGKVEVLQSEIAFGYVISPFFFLFTFIWASVLCGIILLLFKKIKQAVL